MGEQREQPTDQGPEVTGELSETELEQASGGSAWLMPAVQKVREAAALQDGTSNTILFAEVNR